MKVKGFSKNYVYITHRHGQQCGVSWRERFWEGGGRRRWAKGGKTNTDRDLACGDGPTMQGADDVLLSCARETRMIL